MSADRPVHHDSCCPKKGKGRSLSYSHISEAMVSLKRDSCRSAAKIITLASSGRSNNVVLCEPVNACFARFGEASAAVNKWGQIRQARCGTVYISTTSCKLGLFSCSFISGEFNTILNRTNAQFGHHNPKMSLWSGHLCNTTVDVILDRSVALTRSPISIRQHAHESPSFLLLAMVGAYVPQIARLRSLPSAHGISANYILFHAIFSNTQLSSALFLHAYGWPSVRSPYLTAKSPALEQVARGRLRDLAAYGAVLGLLQVIAQWCCAIAL